MIQLAIDANGAEDEPMPAITLTITLDVPEGTGVTINTSNGEGLTSPSTNQVSTEVLEKVRRIVPTRFQQWVELYLERCVAELECGVEFPSGDRDDYLNIFAPPRCRRARVSSITYSSSRTAVFAGAIDVSKFQLVQETMNGDRYAYPKLPQLDSAQAVDEAIELTKLAIERFER